MASIWPRNVLPAMASAVTSTTNPGLSFVKARSGRRKSTLRRRMSSMLTRSVPSRTTSPTATARMPTTPSNGATMRILASRASASCSRASSTVTLDCAVSCALPETKFLLARSAVRLRLARASSSSARACATSASFSDASRPTSTWPCFTSAPSRKPMTATRPVTSGRNCTLWFDRSEPTACSSSTARCGASVTTSTGAGPPPFLASPRAAPLVSAPLGAGPEAGPLSPSGAPAGNPRCTR